jgi:hypothetical protein
MLRCKRSLWWVDLVGQGLTIGILFLLLRGTRLTEANFNRIAIGMTEADVSLILGRPATGEVPVHQSVVLVCGHANGRYETRFIVGAFGLVRRQDAN